MSNTPLAAPKKEKEDVALDLTLRPQRWEEYIGQEHIKKNLHILIEAAKKRNEPVEHVLLSGPAGLGKCITKNALLFTERGILPIGSLAPESENKICPLAIKVFGNPGIATTSHCYQNGIGPTIRITTHQGYQLEGTPNHPVVALSADGKKVFCPLGELHEDDFVAIQRGQNFFADKESLPQFTFSPKKNNNTLYQNSIPHKMTASLARILGYLIGDGYIGRKVNPSSSLVTFTNTDQEILSDFISKWDDLFGQKLTIRRDPYKAPTIPAGNVFIRSFLNSIGLHCATAHHKEIPYTILSAKKEHIKEFLAAYFECDGHIRPDCRQVDIISASEKLIKQIQVVLLNFGIISRVYNDVHKKEGKSYWRLYITGGNVDIFQQEIGFISQRKNEAHRNFHARKNTNKDIIPYAKDLLKNVKAEFVRLNRLLDKKSYRQHARENISHKELAHCLSAIETTFQHVSTEMINLKDIGAPWIFWDRIEQVQYYSAETVDLTIPEGHTFFSNGFISHNTTMAHLIGREMNTNVRVTSGPAIERVGDLASILTNLLPNDILFIDEIHRLNKLVEEVLYPAMEARTLDIIIGKGPSARTLQIELPPFTLIAATTRAGLLSSPLRSRFGVSFRLDFYTPEDIQKIIIRSARLLGVGICQEAYEILARSSRFTPRVANRLLKRMRDYAQVNGDGTITAEIAEKTLALLEIDEKGLEQMDRRILEVIVKKFAGGPVGIRTLAAASYEEVDSIEEVYEPYLMQLGFLERTSRGRVATAQAYRHLGIKIPAQTPLLS